MSCLYVPRKFQKYFQLFYFFFFTEGYVNSCAQHSYVPKSSKFQKYFQIILPALSEDTSNNSRHVSKSFKNIFSYFTSFIERCIILHRVKISKISVIFLKDRHLYEQIFYFSFYEFWNISECKPSSKRAWFFRSELTELKSVGIMFC